MRKLLATIGATLVAASLAGCGPTKKGTDTTPDPRILAASIDPCSFGGTEALTGWSSKELPADMPAARECRYTNPRKTQTVTVWIGGDPSGTTVPLYYGEFLGSYRKPERFTLSGGGVAFVASSKGHYIAAGATLHRFTLKVTLGGSAHPFPLRQNLVDLVREFGAKAIKKHSIPRE